MRRGERILGPIAGNGTAQHAAIGSVTRLAHWRTNAGILHFLDFPQKRDPRLAKGRAPEEVSLHLWISDWGPACS